MAVSDDDIIKRRLLIEGDGGSDERRLNSTLKIFLKWAKDDTSDDSQAVHQRLLSLLAQSESAMAKSCQVYKMNLKERENYDKLNHEIETSIRDAYKKITECKEELHQAKRVRRNRQEYDALAKVIQQHPDRQETRKQLEELDKELASLQESRKSLEQKLEMRKKQFHVLISAIHEMQRILDVDKQKEEADMDTS